MIEKKPGSFSDIVDRAAAELRLTPVPPGPPPELLESLRRAAQDNRACAPSDVNAFAHPSSERSRNQSFSRLRKIRSLIMRNPRKTIASAAACCIVAVAACLIVGPTTRGSVAFAEVAAIIQKAKTMVCTGQDFFVRNGEQVKRKIKFMSLGNHRQRQEIGSQTVIIADYQAGKTLLLCPDAKAATLMRLTPRESQQENFLTELKTITQNPKAENLGLKKIDGKEVKGFRVKKKLGYATFWVDSKSGDPITVEYYHEEKNEPTLVMALSDFQFDVPLEESLFSLTPPKGYDVEELSTNCFGGEENDVVEVLRRIADLDKGVFPDSISDQIPLMTKLKRYTEMKWASKQIKQAAQAENDEKGKPVPPAGAILRREMLPETQKAMDKELAEADILAGRVATFLLVNKGWKYAGKGVKLGDGQTPIFWYVPDQAKQGRVIYGDLRVHDVPIDQLPGCPRFFEPGWRKPQEE
jgi:outer membrane lipoprotein-sorting protein